MQARLYIDTSVIGGFFDEEFSDHTKPLFDRFINSEFKLLISDLTEEELENAPERVKALFISLTKLNFEYLETSDEAIELANFYIKEKVVGKTSFADCLHIALATIHKADFLISWNFKHIVNIERIRGYNSINFRNGYNFLEIRSAREFEYYEK